MYLKIVRTQIPYNRPAELPQYVKPKTAAKILDGSVSWVYKLISTGELESVRIGGCVRVPASALIALTGAPIGEPRP